MFNNNERKGSGRSVKTAKICHECYLQVRPKGFAEKKDEAPADLHDCIFTV